MTKSILLDKFPINSLEIQKNETEFTNIDQFLVYFQEKIEAHPIAAFIATFDHFTHTSSINGDIDVNMKDAKAVIFCFGSQIPSSKILAARPRTIAIAEYENNFVIEFMDAPNEKLQLVMEEWSHNLIVK